MAGEDIVFKRPGRPYRGGTRALLWLSDKLARMARRWAEPLAR